MRPDITPGGNFPDYALPDHTGTVRTLSELQGGEPLILTLARGNYCPKEHQQHLELAANYPKIAVAYTQVATIATDDHHTLQEFRASVGAQWTLPVRSRPDRPAGPRHPGVHRPRAQPHGPAHAGAQAGGWSFTVSITATGSGAARRSTTCGATCAWPPPRSARTGTSARRDCARPGTPATTRSSTAGTGAPRSQRRPPMSHRTAAAPAGPGDPSGRGPEKPRPRSLCLRAARWPWRTTWAGR